MSTSWSIVGPLTDLLKVGVPGTHAFHGLACSLAQKDGDDVEENEHRRLVQAAHRKDALASLVVGHRLGAQVDSCVGRARYLACRLGGYGHSACARRMGDTLECFDS